MKINPPDDLEIISLKDLYSGKTIYCSDCKDGIYKPMNPAAKVNHCYICNKCGDRINIDPAISSE